MGKLVQFENRAKPGNAIKQGSSEPAEILIFTGVRYERQTGAGNTPDKPSASSGGKRKRG